MQRGYIAHYSKKLLKRFLSVRIHFPARVIMEPVTFRKTWVSFLPLETVINCQSTSSPVFNITYYISPHVVTNLAYLR